MKIPAPAKGQIWTDDARRKSFVVEDVLGDLVRLVECASETGVAIAGKRAFDTLKHAFDPRSPWRCYSYSGERVGA